ncbi:MAG: Fe-S cluster assembly protein SufD, partial [Actinobacteria bacterium]|nr:Fe-S cluster assembly protein SufD [Actinomycetota bacterium]
RDSALTFGVISLGGKLVRRSIDSLFSDSSGEIVLLGATHSANGQYCEHRTVVDHNMVNCRSYVDFRSAVDGEGTHSVWIGDTIIRYNATGSDTYETNRNLVLSRGARADSVPNLEIETGEVVGAGHASATGRLDDEHLFYLTSRGITSHDALKLIVVGFFANIVERMGIPALVEDVVATIEAKLVNQDNK